MAAVPLNKFLTVRKTLTTDLTGIYTCPIGVSAIITLCNASNIVTNTVSITGIHSRTVGGGYKFANDEEIPSNDSMNLFPDGRLAMETNDVLYFSASDNNSVDLIISILETAKQ